MKLIQLKYFREVCKQQSITKAAAVMHLTQPTVSSAIRELENEFGVILFHRGNKSLVLTREGEFFLEHAEDILDRASLLEKQMCDFGTNRNSISIGIPPMIGTTVFPPILKQFQEKFPEISMDIREEGAAGTIKHVMDDVYDAALVITDDMDYSVLNVLPVMTSSIVFCTSRKHSEEIGAGKPVSIAMMQDEPLVLFREDYYLHGMLLKRFTDAGITPNTVLSTNQLYTIKSYIEKDMASGFLFDDVARETGLCTHPLVNPSTVHIGLIWKKGKYVPSDVSKFIRFVEKYAESIK